MAREEETGLSDEDPKTRRRGNGSRVHRLRTMFIYREQRAVRRYERRLLLYAAGLAAVVLVNDWIDEIVKAFGRLFE